MHTEMEDIHKANYVTKGTELPCPLWARQSPNSTCPAAQKLTRLCTLGFCGSLITKM